MPLPFRSAPTLLGCLLLALFPETSAAQLLFLSGPGRIDLTIDQAIPGQEPQPDIDSSSNLIWFLTPGVTTKITVSTQCPGQTYSLAVEASGVRRGTAQGTITLQDGMIPMDFIRDIPPLIFLGYGRLNYTAQADVSQGNSTQHGDDFHTITYTITAQ